MQVRAASLLLEAQELGLKGRVLLSEILDFSFKLLAIGLKEGLILGLMVQFHGFFVQRALNRLDSLAKEGGHSLEKARKGSETLLT